MHFLGNVAAVKFNQSPYTVEENKGPAQIALVLNKTAACDLSVIVRATNDSSTAIGKLSINCFMIKVKYVHNII